jgi:hypothetical protein
VEAVNMTNADFFLQIARDHTKKLRACRGPITLGSRGYSKHFTHAVISSMFSAFAVEHALAQLIWVRCFFQTPEPYRRIALQHASGLRTTPQKMAFIRVATRLPEDMLKDIEKLFQYRNGIAHSRVTTFEGKVLDFDKVLEAIPEGKAVDFEELADLVVEREARYLQLPGLSSEDVDIAEANLNLAERAVEALHEAMNSSDWPVHQAPEAKRLANESAG